MNKTALIWTLISIIICLTGCKESKQEVKEPIIETTMKGPVYKCTEKFYNTDCLNKKGKIKNSKECVAKYVRTYDRDGFLISEIGYHYSMSNNTIKLSYTNEYQYEYFYTEPDRCLEIYVEENDKNCDSHHHSTSNIHCHFDKKGYSYGSFCELNEDRRLSKKIEQGGGNFVKYSYLGNKVTLDSYSGGDFVYSYVYVFKDSKSATMHMKNVDGCRLEECYDKKSLIRVENYEPYNNKLYKSRVWTYYHDENREELCGYSTDGTISFRSDINKNLRGDVVRQVFRNYGEDAYTTIDEHIIKYDGFGNKTLDVRNNQNDYSDGQVYSIKTYQYDYYDGTKSFVPETEYPELYVKRTTYDGGVMNYQPSNNSYYPQTYQGTSNTSPVNSTSEHYGYHTETYEESCYMCHGSGKCSTCNGKGWYYGSFSSEPLSCPNCDGYCTGRCHICHGTGKIQKNRQVYN